MSAPNKAIKWLFIAFISSILSGCGGHDFEGVYSLKSGSSDEMANQLLANAINKRVTIGPDYTEIDGQRKIFDKIFIRESGGKKYLVLKNKETEEAWEIIDDNTLVKKVNKYMSFTMKRIK